MKIRGNKTLMKLLAGLLPLLALASCATEENIKPGGRTGGDADVTFAIQLPGAGDPATRALSDADENEVLDIDVLLFAKNGGNYVDKSGCGTAAITTNPGAGNSRFKTFTVTLRQGEYDLVVLANARAIVNAVTFTGKNKTVALAELETVMPAGGKWVSDRTATGYRPDRKSTRLNSSH